MKKCYFLALFLYGAISWCSAQSFEHVQMDIKNFSEHDLNMIVEDFYNDDNLQEILKTEADCLIQCLTCLMLPILLACYTCFSCCRCVAKYYGKLEENKCSKDFL